jgi:hypothetical protein
VLLWSRRWGLSPQVAGSLARFLLCGNAPSRGVIAVPGLPPLHRNVGDFEEAEGQAPSLSHGPPITAVLRQSPLSASDGTTEPMPCVTAPSMPDDVAGLHHISPRAAAADSHKA